MTNPTPERALEIVDKHCGKQGLLGRTDVIAAVTEALGRGVPDGWKLVPIDPDRNQKETGAKFLQGLGLIGAWDFAHELYRRMLNAAPQPSEDK